MKRIKINLLLLGMGLLWGAIASQAASLFYVYKDRNGKTVMQDQIPQELKYRGYKIVNANGVTLKVVPPTKKPPTPDKALDLSRLPSSDILLLRNYSSVFDIEAARDSRVTQIHDIINGMMAHREAFERNLEALMERSTNLKKEGKLVPPKLTQDIRMVQARIEENRRYVHRKELESAELLKQYNADIKRFKQLQSHATE